MKRTIRHWATLVVAAIALSHGASAQVANPSPQTFTEQALAAETATTTAASNVTAMAGDIRQAMIAIRPGLAAAAPGGGGCPVACASVCAYAAAVASVTCEAHAFATATCPDGSTVTAEGFGFATATAVGFGLACAQACTDGSGFGFGGGGGGVVGGGVGGGGVVVTPGNSCGAAGH